MVYNNVHIPNNQTIDVLGSDSLSVFIPKSISNSKTIQAVYSSADKVEGSVVIYVEEITDVARCLLTVLNLIEQETFDEDYLEGVYKPKSEIYSESFTYSVRAEYNATEHRFQVTLLDMEDNDSIGIEAYELASLAFSLLKGLSEFDKILIANRTKNKNN